MLVTKPAPGGGGGTTHVELHASVETWPGMSKDAVQHHIDLKAVAGSLAMRRRAHAVACSSALYWALTVVEAQP
jgi:hypothetical protein